MNQEPQKTADQERGTNEETGLPLTSWDLLLACLSVYVLAAFAIELLFHVPPEAAKILHAMDTFLCLLFLSDFCRKLWLAPCKRKYLKWGWIDLLASIPALDAFRWGRVVSVARIFILLRAVRSARLLWQVTRREPPKAIMSLTLLATVIVIIASSLIILRVETAERSNIKTGMDALWWSLTTITTVGYGDHFPVTIEGRVVAAVLMGLGIALYGTFTAFISGRIMELTQKQAEEESTHLPVTEVSSLKAEVILLREQVAALRESVEQFTATHKEATNQSSERTE